MDESLPRFAIEPETVIGEIVRSVDSSCATIDITALLEEVFCYRSQRRTLAEVLHTDAELLTSGRPEGPRTVERLIRALQAKGATGLVLPRCGKCGRQRPLTALADGRRICRSCANRRQVQANPCGICGSIDYAGRDRDGTPRCRAHPPGGDIDPAVELAGRLAGPTGLPIETAVAAIRAVARNRGGQLRLLWAFEDHPDLLSGGGAKGPPKTGALARALINRGATGVQVPRCPLCDRAAELRLLHQGQRCCGRCWLARHREVCADCERLLPVGGRTFDGKPVCVGCRQADPFNRRCCDGCGQLRVVKARTGDGRALCSTCHDIPRARCATCGELGPCRFVTSEAPRCLSCCAKQRKEAICVGCGNWRRVNNRTATGEPLCGNCGKKPKPCDGCGKVYRVSARTADGRGLCQTCWAKHPAARQPCAACGSVERLYHHGLCAACAAPRSLHRALAGPNGRLRPELEGVYTALLRLPPHASLRWSNRRPTHRALLQALAVGTGLITHESLDPLAPAQIVDHLRALLVAGEALPERDEQLARLERWVTRTVARVPNPTERRLLTHYTAWQPLRRLRRVRPGRHITVGQGDSVRMEIRNTVRLLEWLHGGGIPLAEATQDHIDTWLSQGSTQRHWVRAFLLWTSRSGHSRPLTAPAHGSELSFNVIAQDHRWALVRRLVTDHQLAVPDRAAGLLVLLFAQPPSRITRLTTDHVLDTGEHVRLRLGREPVLVPAPLDDLLRELVNRRRGRSTIPPGREPTWLFHGIYPGRAMDPSSLSRRLRAIGVQPRQARNASLMDVASELPAYVFSRLLGYCQKTADNWNTEASGFGPDYAADLTRR
ncbi:hypothetical protein [Streptomyces sp. 067-1]|uniref:hypothetical protein n=1 Tax=Streptomyces sp. 067-1 TaxID=2789269 RepID=UPI0039F5F00C